MNQIGIVVGLGYVSEDEEAGAAVESVAIGQVFTDDVVGEVAGAAHDALFDVPRVRADLEHFQIMIGLVNKAIGVAEVKFDELGEIAEIGDDGDFCAVGAKGVADRIGGIVRDGEGRDFDVADGEAFAGADVLDAFDFLGGGFGQNAQDFGVRSFREIRGSAPVSEKLRKAARVVRVLVGNENAVDAFGGGIVERGETAKSFFAAKTGVDREAGALGFKQRGVA